MTDGEGVRVELLSLDELLRALEARERLLNELAALLLEPCDEYLQHRQQFAMSSISM